MNERTSKALILARDTFRRYEALHRAKGTDDGEAKARANAVCAVEMELALAAVPQSEPLTVAPREPGWERDDFNDWYSKKYEGVHSPQMLAAMKIGFYGAIARYEVAQTATPHRGRDDAIAQAVKTCIEFGLYDTNKPPEGHWLTAMWAFGASLRPQTATPQGEPVAPSYYGHSHECASRRGRQCNCGFGSGPNPVGYQVVNKSGDAAGGFNYELCRDEASMLDDLYPHNSPHSVRPLYAAAPPSSDGREPKEQT